MNATIIEVDIAGIVEEDRAADLITKLVTLCPEWPDDHLKTKNVEIFIDASPADFLEERRIWLGDIAMALEFGEPKLPPKAGQFVRSFVDDLLSAPLAIDDAEISSVLDNLDMNFETRLVRVRS